LQKDSDGNFVFVGIVNGVGLKAKIAPQATGGYRLTARAYGVNLAALANPVTIKIAIGDDNGTTSVKADFDDDEDDDVDED